MKNYLPKDTPLNRNRGLRAGDIFFALVIVISLGLLLMRNWGVPSEKELQAIDRQVEILELQQAQQSLKYDLGVQQQEQEVFQSSIDILGESAAIQLDMQDAVTRGLAKQIETLEAEAEQ